MAYGDRKSGRVDFERGIPVYMMGIDGTWRRECMMIDVSQTGARLLVEGSLEGLDLKEAHRPRRLTEMAQKRGFDWPASGFPRQATRSKPVATSVSCQFACLSLRNRIPRTALDRLRCEPIKTKYLGLEKRY